MKRINNKYRNNNGNGQIYSLNYKFDSSSPAGKFSGTALDLIKRYNELAKDAAGNSDYVMAEVYRQYAEHYRKIVTEINEKKNQNRMQNFSAPESQAQNAENLSATEEPKAVENAPVTETKSFTVVEIPHSEAQTAGESTAESAETIRKPKRVYRRRQQQVVAE